MSEKKSYYEVLSDRERRERRDRESREQARGFMGGLHPAKLSTRERLVNVLGDTGRAIGAAAEDIAPAARKLRSGARRLQHGVRSFHGAVQGAAREAQGGFGELTFSDFDVGGFGLGASKKRRKKSGFVLVI